MIELKFDLSNSSYAEELEIKIKNKEFKIVIVRECCGFYTILIFPKDTRIEYDWKWYKKELTIKSDKNDLSPNKSGIDYEIDDNIGFIFDVENPDKDYIVIDLRTCEILPNDKEKILKFETLGLPRIAKGKTRSGYWYFYGKYNGKPVISPIRRIRDEYVIFRDYGNTYHICPLTEYD